MQIKPIYSVNDKDCMLINIPLNKLITFNSFLNNGIKAQGDNFWLYDSISNNCQKFVNILLKTNNLGNEQIFKFVEQNVNDLVVKPVQQMAHFITDLAARIDLIKYGKGLY